MRTDQTGLVLPMALLYLVVLTFLVTSMLTIAQWETKILAITRLQLHTRIKAKSAITFATHDFGQHITQCLYPFKKTAVRQDADQHWWQKNGCNGVGSDSYFIIEPYQQIPCLQSGQVFHSTTIYRITAVAFEKEQESIEQAYFSRNYSLQSSCLHPVTQAIASGLLTEHFLN